MTMLNKVKIIAGQWRGRYLTFPEANHLRPTPNRVRETLFNWLMPYLEGTSFLDAFGGSGALSFEALSRGASHGVFIDQSPSVRQYAQSHAQRLNTDALTIVAGESPQCFASLQPNKAFDIVFLDPPFQQDLLKPCLQALKTYHLIHSHSLVYFEAEQSLDPNSLREEGFRLFKQGQAGQVRYGLLQMELR